MSSSTASPFTSISFTSSNQFCSFYSISLLITSFISPSSISSSFIFSAILLKIDLCLMATLSNACWNYQKFIPIQNYFRTCFPIVTARKIASISFESIMKGFNWNAFPKKFQASRTTSWLCFLSVKERQVFLIKNSYVALRFRSNF